MKTKFEIVSLILGERKNNLPCRSMTQQFAPANIALCKYWGKRDQELNLPMTSSLSISLKNKGTLAELSLADSSRDVVILNNTMFDKDDNNYKLVTQFLALFRPNSNTYFHIRCESNIPIAAGLASSASSFAALILALDQLFAWHLTQRELSLLARLGSGSACRSIWQGFVEWHKGAQADGLDSYGEPISKKWPHLCIGLLIISTQKKVISSRQAMQHTISTSPFYISWPEIVAADLLAIKQAINDEDFALFGKVVEANALAMHATLLGARPPICYFLPETLNAMQKIWQLRLQNLTLFFTQDAGPNLILFFLDEDREQVCGYFPTLEVVQPFLDE